MISNHSKIRLTKNNAINLTRREMMITKLDDENILTKLNDEIN